MTAVDMSQAKENQNPVMELVTFQSKEGLSVEQVRQMADDIMPTLRKLDGFIDRELAYDADSKTWYDILRWESMEAALAAVKEVNAAPSSACQSFFGIFEPGTTRMFHLSSVIPRRK